MTALSEEEKMVIDTVRKIAERELAPRAAALDEQAGFPEHALEVFAAQGLLNPLLPTQYGGGGMSVSLTVRIIEEIARVCASSALLIIAQTDGMLPILHGGSKRLKEKYLSRLGGESKLLTAFAATEPQAGSDLLAMRTRARREGAHWILDGQKCFITNGSVADIIVVYAYTDPAKRARGLSAFVVEKGMAGLKYGRNERKMGMRGSVNSELFFEGLKVPEENLIGDEGSGFANLMQTLELNRLFCAAQAVGIAQGAMEQAIAFARQRVQFGKPIAQLEPIQFMIADMAAGIQAARQLCLLAAGQFDAGDRKTGALNACLAKFFASDHAMQVAIDAVQVMGGYGYMKDYPVERMMRDAKLTQIYTGTNQITRLVAGRSLLAE